MRVSLVSYTPEARELLILSKSTRLDMHSSLMQKIRDMSEEEKETQIKYVLGSTGSSLEFVDYVFLIEGVSRNFTHQFVRSRVGTSFAQQSLRVVEESDFDYLAENSCREDDTYHEAMAGIKEKYRELIKSGIS